jgi:hypothetical protein
VEQLAGTHDALKVGIDVIGGIAGSLTAMFDQAGIAMVHVTGLAVNRARQATMGWEHKSDLVTPE